MKRPWFWVLVVLAVVAGFVLGRATGTTTLSGLAEIHKEFPLFPAPPKPDAVVPDAPSTQENDIVVEVPVEGASVADSFVDVAGRAKTAGGPLRVILKNASGTVIAEADMEVTSTDGSAYGRFGRTLSFAGVAAGSGVVEISRSAGGEKIVRNVTFVSGAKEDGLAVKVYFSKMGTGADECSAVFPVERKIDDGSAAFRSTIEALLGGPTTEEKAEGYLTSLPAGTAIKSVALDAEGVVTADFTQTLEKGVAGSCRVAAIRSQIEATLRQFPEVRGVVISVNGRTDDILQP